MGGGVQIDADFDDMTMGFTVPSSITRLALVGRDMTIRKALVQPDGAQSIPGIFANDDLFDRPTFTGPFEQPGMTNIGYSGEPGEHDPITDEVAGPFMASAWYRFIATTTGDHDILTDYLETDFDTTLGIYDDPSGNGTMADIMAALIDSDDDGGSGFRSHIYNVPLVAGSIYAVRVDGYEGDQGNYTVGVMLS